MSDTPRICLVSASGQNVYFAEILEAFGAALQDAGVTVEESVDCFPPPAEDLVYIYVPHEYHPLVHELSHPTKAQLRRTVAVGTEQPGTSWFDTSAALAAQAGAVVDINALGVAELNRRGIAAEHAPLGYAPAWDEWGKRDLGERPIDLVFLGGATERRMQVLARCAKVLSGRRASIHLTETAQPHVAGKPHYLANERKWRLLTQCKVMLNVHRSELAYTEWHRMIGALLNGCVVLTEHSLGTEPLLPGVHFVSAGYFDLPLVLEALLADPERLRQIRHAAYDLVREEMPVTDTSAGLLRAIERAAENRATKDASHPLAVPMPMSPPPQQPGWEAYSSYAGDSLPVRLALKHLVVHGRGLERRLESLARKIEDATDTVQWLGPERENARVSVILTVHNYEDFVGDALRSVALADLSDVEVIAVDDASTDRSVDAIRAACEQSPWLSVKLVRSSHNRGLPAARNLAVEHASAELLFVLDADNMVMPQGLGRLATALEQDADAAFAYGLIETFDANGPVGLMNWLDWDSNRLPYGNYVDAMSMIRRSALEAVGGYPTDPTLYGWEDFAVWVAMADRGMHGVRVPDFVARYRVSPQSMISLANIDSSAAWTTLLRRYAVLSRAVAPTARG